MFYAQQSVVFSTINGLYFAHSTSIFVLYSTPYMRVTTHQVTFHADADALNDVERIRKALDTLVDACGLTKLEELTHRFTPQGISLVYVLAESHVAIHTWPEHSYAYITLSSCATENISTEEITAIICDGFDATDTSVKLLEEEMSHV